MLDKLKEIIKLNTEKSGNNKKNIENLVVFLILLIVTVISINVIWGKEKTTENSQENQYKTLAENLDKDIISNNNEETEYNLQEELEEILSKIDGVRQSKSINYLFRN